MIAVELIAVPKRGQPRDGIKIFDAINTRNHLVVVAADESSTKFTHASRDFIWIGVISDDIAQVDHNVRRWRDRQARLQSFQIAVDITQKKYAQTNHRSPSISYPDRIGI